MSKIFDKHLCVFQVFAVTEKTLWNFFNCPEVGVTYRFLLDLQFLLLFFSLFFCLPSGHEVSITSMFCFYVYSLFYRLTFFTVILYISQINIPIINTSIYNISIYFFYLSINLFTCLFSFYSYVYILTLMIL